MSDTSEVGTGAPVNGLKGKPSARNGAVDFFRFICAVLIVLLHSENIFSLIGVKETIAPDSRMAVEFFLIVSGWLLAAKANRDKSDSAWDGTLLMLRGKLMHIFPYVFIATVFSIVFYVVGMFFGPDIFSLRQIGQILVYSVSELFGVQMFGFKGYWATGGGWYLSALYICCFLIYPFLLRRRDAFVKYFAPAAALFIYGFICHEWESLGGPGDWKTFVYKGLVRGFAGICLGCCCHELTQVMNKSSLRRPTVFALEAGGMLAFILFCFLNTGKNGWRAEFLIPPVLFLAVGAMFSEKSVLSKVFRGGFFRFIGAFSLNLFLDHYFIGLALEKLKFYFTSEAMLLSVYFGLIIIMSVLNYFLGRLLEKKMSVKLMIILSVVLVLCGCVVLIASIPYV